MRWGLLALVGTTEGWSAFVGEASKLLKPSASALEAAALQAARTEDNRALLRSVEALEQFQPTDARLLETAAGGLLEGTWRLVGTIAAQGGEELETGGRRNVVNASGFAVDASERNVPLQTIDLATNRIVNEVRLENVPFLSHATVRVEGSFTADGRRVVVDFDRLSLCDSGAVVLSNAWLFRLARALRPKLFTGDTENSAWLETTYLSDRLRVGRGNKGSCFLLERC